MYFKLATGRIVTETKLELAYEINFGRKANLDGGTDFAIWMRDLNVEHIPESEITVEQLIKGNAIVDACMLYKRQHNCTLREAKEMCEEIKTKLIYGGKV